MPIFNKSKKDDQVVEKQKEALNPESVQLSRQAADDSLEFLEIYQGMQKSIIPTDMKSVLDLEETIGLPPSCHLTEQEIKNTMPVIEIVPCISKFILGSQVYTLQEQFGKYSQLLEKLGYKTPNTQYMKFAFLADSFPTDTFNNQYGESFLNRLSNVASQGAGDLAQFFGATSAGRAAEQISGAMSKIGGTFGKESTIGQAIKAAGEMGMKGIQSAGRGLERLQNSGGAAGTVAGMARMVSRMLAGQRVDFPQVWKGSGFSPSYSMTIRLYNPNPADPAATRKFIAGPLSAILLLGVPQSDNGDTYSWPFLHKIRCKGIFELNTAFISNISVVKGGDSQQIAWNQSLSIVDVRIDFGSIFNSMVAMTNGETGDRPTIKKYVDNLIIGSSSSGEDKYPKAHYSPDWHPDLDSFKEKTEAELKELEEAFGPRNKRLSPAQEERGFFERVSDHYKDVADNLRSSINTNTGFNI